MKHNEHLLLILLSTGLLGPSRLGWAWLFMASSCRVSPRLLHHVAPIFPGPAMTRARSYHNRKQETRGQDQLCSTFQPSARRTPAKRNHTIKLSVNEPETSHLEGQPQSDMIRGMDQGRKGVEQGAVLINNIASHRCQAPSGHIAKETDSRTLGFRGTFLSSLQNFPHV